MAPPLKDRLLNKLDHAKWILVISYSFYDADGKKMLEIYNKIFESNITMTGFHYLKAKDKWEALQFYYPELNLPRLGDGYKIVYDKTDKDKDKCWLESTYPEFEAIRTQLLEFIPELNQYIA